MDDRNGTQADILIVDDSPANIEILREALPRDYRIRTAMSGRQALEVLAQTGPLPDLILLDVMMPEMDGYETCRRLQQDLRLRDVPVIFVSAVAETRNRVRALSLGAVDYITKPFHFQEVRARVSIHLRLHALQNQLRESNRGLEAKVLEKVREVYDAQREVILALSNLVAQREDRSASGSLERMKAISRLLALQLRQDPRYDDRIDDAFVDSLVQACTLRDIGKVNVPDAILRKRDPHTEEEDGILKRHTVIGAQTLQEVQAHFPGNAFIDMGIDISRHHHERWDGTGYPDGLSGEDIPLSAQIVALADRIEHFGSRTREGHAPPSDIRAELGAGSGTEFAPALLEAYRQVADAIDALYGR